MTMTANEENLPLYKRNHHSNTHYRYISQCGCDRNREITECYYSYNSCNMEIKRIEEFEEE